MLIDLFGVIDGMLAAAITVYALSSRGILTTDRLLLSFCLSTLLGITLLYPGFKMVPSVLRLLVIASLCAAVVLSCLAALSAVVDDTDCSSSSSATERGD